MNQFSRVILLIAVLVGVAFAQGDYYPGKTGQKWTYSNGTVQEFVAQKTVNGQTVSVLVTSLSGKVVSEQYFQSSPQGVFWFGARANNKLDWYSSAIVVYPAAPLKTGMRWSSSSKTASGTLALTARVLGSEGIQTPAGRFNAFRVRSSVTTSSGASSVSDLFFVPGVGTVRYVTQDGSAVDLVSR